MADDKKLSPKQVSKLIEEQYWAAAPDSKIGDELMKKVENYFTTLNTSGQYERLQSSYAMYYGCLLYTSPSPRDRQKSRMPSSA